MSAAAQKQSIRQRHQTVMHELRHPTAHHSERKANMKTSSKAFFVHHFVNTTKADGNNFWRPWLINRSFLSAFTESEASSVFIRLHSRSFEVSNGFKSLPVLLFRSGDLQELSTYLKLFSAKQNVDLEFDGVLMDPRVAKECGETVNEFFSQVPPTKFIHLNIPGTLQGLDPEAHSRLANAFLSGIRDHGEHEKAIDVSCDSICLQHLAEIPIHKLRVGDYNEELCYSDVFHALRAEIISIPNFPLDIFELIDAEPNENVKEIVVELTIGHDKEYYNNLLVTLSTAFPRLCEFKLEGTFSTIDCGNHLEILDEMANDCEILADLEATFRILGSIRFYYKDKHECKNYEVLKKHGFDKRLKGCNNYMICTGTNTFELSLWNMM